MGRKAKEVSSGGAVVRTASGPWTDLGLTLPVFLGYHLGVVFLPVRNAADVVTRELVELADNNMLAYGLLTLCLAITYVGVLVVAGRGKALRWPAFLRLGLEGVAYAAGMQLLASYVVGRVFLGPVGTAGPFSGLVLSLGAGFYEELAFRVLAFGLGCKAIKVLFPLTSWQRPLVFAAWGVLVAGVFALWHYIGPLGDPLDLKSFVFRWVCGVVFTVIFVFRGFAPAVWTHALYDIWVLVL